MKFENQKVRPVTHFPAFNLCNLPLSAFCAGASNNKTRSTSNYATFNVEQFRGSRHTRFCKAALLSYSSRQLLYSVVSDEDFVDAFVGVQIHPFQIRQPLEQTTVHELDPVVGFQKQEILKQFLLETYVQYRYL